MDTLEQRLTADLTDAAEAAMADGLTPPDRAAITAGVAARQRKRRLRVGVAVAACVLAVAGAVAALSGDDPSRTEMYPATTGTTGGPATSSTSTPTTGSTNPTAPDTTPNDPEQPGLNTPNPVPITEDMVRDIAYPFNQGTDAMPAPCRDYWDTSGFTPEGNGLSPDQNGILIDQATITLADIDGDGTDDGMAAFTCETNGVLPPGGVIALIAEPGEGDSFYGIYLDDGTIDARHEQQFGDPRTRFTGPFELVGDPTGLREITVELDSWRADDADAGGSARAIARYRVTGNTLELVDLQEI
jgi:hypothetical protein